MADDMPPLVDRYTMRPSTSASSVWPPAPPTPGDWGASPLPSQWGGVPLESSSQASPWGHHSGCQTPMFGVPMTLGGVQAAHQAGWPVGVGGVGMPGMMLGASPAVTSVPIPMTAMPTGTTHYQATGVNDDWVDLSNAGWDDEEERSRDLGFAPRPLSRQGSRTSRRSRTPFSGDSSPSSSQSSDLSRSRSFGSVSIHDKRPPREWRSDFTMGSPTLGSAIGNLLNLSGRKRSGSVSRRGSFSVSRVVLHPYLRYSSSMPPMYLDLRDNPDQVRFHHLGRHINPWDLTRFACEPPLMVMTFYCAKFPWYIEAKSSNPSGVTLYDMFSAIWTCMRTPITNEDFYNNEMDEAMRERIADAWSERCGDNRDERAMGVKRVDFLMDKVGLEGVAKGKDGMWELKVTRPK